MGMSGLPGFGLPFIPQTAILRAVSIPSTFEEDTRFHTLGQCISLRHSNFELEQDLV